MNRTMHTKKQFIYFLFFKLGDSVSRTLFGLLATLSPALRCAGGEAIVGQLAAALSADELESLGGVAGDVLVAATLAVDELDELDDVAADVAADELDELEDDAR